MAVSYGFYNGLYSSNSYDKLYESGQMSKLFDGIIVDGVYLSDEGSVDDKQFLVKAPGGMFVTVAPGRAWFNGTFTINSEDYTLPINTASSSYDRIDAVVIEVNLTRSVRANSIRVIQGIPASTPTKPTMVHSDGVDQYPLAYVTVPKSTTEIKSYDIEYVVGTVTPYFAWIGERLSISEIYSKWESILGIITMPFVSWFDSMQNMLGNGSSDYQNIVNEINRMNSNVYIYGTLPKVNESTATFSGDGIEDEFIIDPGTGNTISSIADIYVDGEIVHEYQFDSSTNTVTLKEAPPVGTNNVTVNYVLTAGTYTLYFS